MTALNAPQDDELHDTVKVTPALAESLVTVAVMAEVPFVATDVGLALTETVIGFVPPVVLLEPLLQPTRAATMLTAITAKKV